MTTTRPRALVLQAGLRVPSSTRLLADEIAAAVAEQGLEVEVVDLRDHAHPIMDAMLAGFPSGDLADLLERARTAQALVVVTPTFQGSFSGLFKSFIDLVEPGAWAGIPVVLAATGGTERHSLVLEHALRPLLVHLGADPVRTAIFAATSDFGSAALGGRARRAAAELVSRLGTRPESPARATVVPPTADAGPASDGFGGELVDFETMMGNLGVGR